MMRCRMRWLAMVIIFASTSVSVEAATESERIAALQQQLNQHKVVMQQQQRLLEAMSAELESLQGAESDVVMQAAEAVSPHQSPAAASLAKADDENSRKLSATVYGFLQADAMYDFKRVAPDWEDTLRVTTIPTTSGVYGADGDFLFSVRHTTVGMRGGYGNDITYRLEWDLFGVGQEQGQTTFNLRNAWATYKNLGAGEVASNFMDPDVAPNILDYWGPTGWAAYRNQQVRYTLPLGKAKLSFSLEDPNTALTVAEGRSVKNCNVPNPSPQCESVESRGEQLFEAYNDVPDLAVRYRQDGDFGHFQVAGILRKLGYQRLDNQSKAYETGWGINSSASINTWGADNLKVQLAYGDGIGDYITDGGIDIAPNAVSGSSNSAEAVPLLGVMAYYEHYWNDRWSTTAGWSMTDLDTTEGQLPTEFSRGQIAQINLIHYPVDNVLLGTEFLWGEREDVDGNVGSDYRLLFSLRVNFDTGDLLQ